MEAKHLNEINVRKFQQITGMADFLSSMQGNTFFRNNDIMKCIKEQNYHLFIRQVYFFPT